MSFVCDDIIMNAQIERLEFGQFPRLLREIADPPEQLYIRGAYPSDEHLFLCVIGSRKYTPYGKAACQALIEGLRGYPIVVVSGLALGMDAIAHEAALFSGLPTVAVPGSGLHESVLYPRSNVGLAGRILRSGGALLSEFLPEHRARPENFPQRNRVMAGLSHATLIIEAQERSGTLITARLAMEYNRDVLAVPGSIFSAQSTGSHYLLRNGATPITSTQDLLDALGFETARDRNHDEIPPDCSEGERALLLLLDSPKDRDLLTQELGRSVAEVSSLISLLEMRGLIKERAGLIART